MNSVVERSTQATKLIKDSRDKMNLYPRLSSFFHRTSSFNIRWKKKWSKDHISQGVYFEEFLEEFTRKEYKRCVELSLVKPDRYRCPKTGGARAAVIFSAELLPQVTKLKSFMCGEWITKRFFRNAALTLVLTMLALAFIFAVSTKLASAMGKAKTTPIITEEYPIDSKLRYFHPTNDAEVTCYWVKYKDHISLSCVR